MAPVYNFICVTGVDQWQTYTRRPHLEPLKSYGRMIVFEAPVTFGRFSLFEVLRHLFFSKHRIRRHEDNLIVIKPVSLVPLRLAGVSRFLRRIHLASMKAYVERYADKNAIRVLILVKAYHHLYVKEFGEQVTTMDYNDKFDLYPRLFGKRKVIVRNNEASILKKADIIFATASMLKREAERYNANAHWLPNCIESNFTKKTFKPSELESIKGPIIGHVGNINSWLDLKLINFLAERNPDFSFVFVGDTESASEEFKGSEDFKRTLNRPNIHYLGRKEYSDLYSYIKAFDVCCIYYNVDEFKKYVHPNKFYMYMSAGRPVVTTDFLPEAKSFFGELISIAKTYEGFDNCIKKCLGEDNVDLKNRRMDFAKRNDNINRAEQRFKIIEDFVNGSSMR